MSAPRIRVLLADDERDFAAAVVTVLQRRGFLAESVADGSAAVEKARTGDFDVVVLDVRMPGIDGLAALDAIRGFDPAIPVLLLTAHAELDAAARGMVAGAADVLLKPCPVDELVAAIEDAHERRTFASPA